MKPLIFRLTILVICFIFIASFTDNIKATTEYCIVKITATNQPHANEMNNPVWYKLFAPSVICGSTEFTPAQMNMMQATLCATDSKLCLVQIKIVDGTAIEIKGTRVGRFID